MVTVIMKAPSCMFNKLLKLSSNVQMCILYLPYVLLTCTKLHQKVLSILQRSKVFPLTLFGCNSELRRVQQRWLESMLVECGHHLSISCALLHDLGAVILENCHRVPLVEQSPSPFRASWMIFSLTL